MKLNGEKCRLMVFWNKSTETTIKICNSEIKESDLEETLGIAIDKKLNFNQHIEDLYR